MWFLINLVVLEPDLGAPDLVTVALAALDHVALELISVWCLSCI